MSNTQTLLDFYSALAKSMDMTVSTDGTLMKAGDDDVFRPAEISGLTLVMPTSEVLSKSPWDTKIAFHPLGEVSHMNQSMLLKGMTTHMRDVVLARVVFLMSNLLLWSVKDPNGNNHGLKTVAQKNYQAKVGEVTKAAAKKFASILSQVTPSGETALISFKLSRRQVVDGVTHPRFCRVTFPLYKALLEWTPEHPEVWDVKLSQKEHDLFVNLFHIILPQINTTGYSRGSKAQEAQWFDALVRSFAALMEDINKVSEPFKGMLPTANRPTDLGWVKFLDTIDSYAGLIPSLPNTQGTQMMEDADQAPSANMGKVAPPPPPPAPPASQPQGRRVSLSSIAPPVAPQPPMPPMGMGYPQMPMPQPGYPMPQPGYPYPMQPQPMVPGYPYPMPQQPMPMMGYPQPYPTMPPQMPMPPQGYPMPQQVPQHQPASPQRTVQLSQLPWGVRS